METETKRCIMMGSDFVLFLVMAFIFTLMGWFIPIGVIAVLCLITVLLIQQEEVNKMESEEKEKQCIVKNNDIKTDKEKLDKFNKDTYDTLMINEIINFSNTGDFTNFGGTV